MNNLQKHIKFINEKENFFTSKNKNELLENLKYLNDNIKKGTSFYLVSISKYDGKINIQNYQSITIEGYLIQESFSKTFHIEIVTNYLNNSIHAERFFNKFNFFDGEKFSNGLLGQKTNGCEPVFKGQHLFETKNDFEIFKKQIEENNNERSFVERQSKTYSFFYKNNFSELVLNFKIGLLNNWNSDYFYNEKGKIINSLEKEESNMKIEIIKLKNKIENEVLKEVDLKDIKEGKFYFVLNYNFGFTIKKVKIETIISGKYFSRDGFPIFLNNGRVKKLFLFNKNKTILDFNKIKSQIIPDEKLLSNIYETKKFLNKMSFYDMFSSNEFSDFHKKQIFEKILKPISDSNKNLSF